MNRLTASFQFQIPPQCPICREPLQNNCFSFVDDIAYCHVDAPLTHVGLHKATSDTWHILQSRGQTTQSHGLHFFTPTLQKGSRLAAHLLAAALANPAAPPPQSPIRTAIDPRCSTKPTAIEDGPASEWSGYPATPVDDRDQT